MDDGSLEAQGYTSRDYHAVNEPMIVQEPGTIMADPDRWQPLALEISYAQNGQLLPIGPQEFIGPHWGEVTSFALPEPVVPGLPIDPGDPAVSGRPRHGRRVQGQGPRGRALQQHPRPARRGHGRHRPGHLRQRSAGHQRLAGHEFNPYTSLPYEPVPVPRADFGRVLAEFWADGPDSETPPGHWNTLANTVSDHPDFERRLGGRGPELDPLEWDVKLYLALNGAVHDAAVAAWGAKGHYDYVRPISMIRYMGGLGQSSDPDLPSYHPHGLPLIEGEVELITAGVGGARRTPCPPRRPPRRDRHPGLVGQPRRHRDRARRGRTGSARSNGCPTSSAPSSRPRSRATSSGHSTFSRAAAEVLTRDDRQRSTSPAAWAAGPCPRAHSSSSWTVGRRALQWATYYDAADQAGISRLYGGIHVEADDLRGRVMGAQCGLDA